MSDNIIVVNTEHEHHHFYEHALILSYVLY